MKEATTPAQKHGFELCGGVVSATWPSVSTPASAWRTATGRWVGTHVDRRDCQQLAAVAQLDGCWRSGTVLAPFALLLARRGGARAVVRLLMYEVKYMLLDSFIFFNR